MSFLFPKNCFGKHKGNKQIRRKLWTLQEVSYEAGFTRFPSEYEMGSWAKPEFTLRKLAIMWNEALLLRSEDPTSTFCIKSHISYRPPHIRHIKLPLEYTTKSIICTQFYFGTPAICVRMCVYMKRVLAYWDQGVHLLLKKGKKNIQKETHLVQKPDNWNSISILIACIIFINEFLRNDNVF